MGMMSRHTAMRIVTYTYRAYIFKYVEDNMVPSGPRTSTEMCLPRIRDTKYSLWGYSVLRV